MQMSLTLFQKRILNYATVRISVNLTVKLIPQYLEMKMLEDGTYQDQGWAKIFIKIERFLKILILYKTSPGRFFKILILFFTRRKEKIKSFLYNA